MGGYLKIAAVLAGGLLAGSPARAQYYEDATEPAALGIRDLDSLSTPKAEYLGNDVCRQCHEAAYQTWLGTAHPRVSVQLGSALAKKVAAQMQMTADTPARSGTCLACHATAADVPAAYRGPGFRITEGVSCEKCHGPGSDHVRYWEDPHSGADSSLVRPEEQLCGNCHKPKKSHEVLDKKHSSFAEAWPKIAHPLAAERPEDEMEPVELGIRHLEETGIPAANYVGSAACGQCHEDAYGRWRQSAHARAFAGLRSELGYAMDLQAGATVGGPARNGTCLSCHATAADAPAARRESGFRLREGVGCEKCHGPGGDHVQAMANHQAVRARGLKQHPQEATCLGCHKAKRSHEKLGRAPFAFPQAWEAIAH